MTDTSPPKRRGGTRLLLIGLLIALGAGVYAWRSNERFHDFVVNTVPGMKGSQQTAAKAPPPAPSAVPVNAVKAAAVDFPVILTGLGTVQAANTVLIRSRVDGQIIRIHFKEGQIVNKGDVLAEIDPRPYKAALEQAQAKLQQDQASLANSNRDLTRYQSLAKNDYATRQQLDTQTSQVAQLTAQIASDQAAIDNAQTQLDYATIKSPLTGRVGFRLADQGNIIQASSTTGIVSIAQLQPIAVIFTEPENSLPQLQAGVNAGTLPVEALTTDGKTSLAQGKLDTLNNEVDAGSGTIRIKALFDNTDNKLWPGLSVTTRTVVRTIKDATTVPIGAVQRGQKGFYAYVVGDNSKVQLRPLKITLMGDTQAVIEDGIKPGEMVVTAGQYRLQAGYAGEGHGRGPENRKQGALSDGRRNFRTVHPLPGRDHAADDRRCCASGLVAYPLLPVAPLPQVDFPTIQVSASLPGASPETMASSVAQPLERQFAQIPGVAQLTSSSYARARPASRCSSTSTATSTGPPTTCRRPSTLPAASCPRTCRARRPTERSIRPTARS